MSFNIKCPICREAQLVALDAKESVVYGVSDLCIVCMTNTVNLMLPKCRHACLCSGCFDIMKPKKTWIVEEDIPVDILNKAKDIMSHHQKGVVDIMVGMGCIMCVRKSSETPYEGFFMHSDSWGQYEGIDDRPLMQEFKSGYHEYNV